MEIDFGKIMERMRKIRAEISEMDSAIRFSKFLGCDVYLGDAKFLNPNQVHINGKTLNFLKCCIATGSSPNIPQINGLDKVKFHTSDTIFNLTQKPKSMVIIGGGYIACELG